MIPPNALASDIYSKFINLSGDFIGITFTIFGIIRFFEIIFITVCFLALLYLLGEKISFLFFPSERYKVEKHFVRVALGYIFTGTSLCILGILSLLSDSVLLFFMSVLIVIAIFPLKRTVNHLHALRKNLKQIDWVGGRHRFVKAVTAMFVIICLLRLIPPDVGVDALDYHTMYPKLYLKEHTMMLAPLGNEAFVTLPQLGEMLYMVVAYIGFLDAARFVHFSFFVLILLVLWHVGVTRFNGFGRYAPLLFATSPIVFHIAPSAYSDFLALFLWLTSVMVLTRDKTLTRRSIALSAILFGGVLASKIWAIGFLLVFILYILFVNRKYTFSLTLLHIIFFSVISLSLGSIWYLRSYILSGDLFYYSYNYGSELFNFRQKYRLDTVLDFSPLAVISFMLFIFFNPIKNIKKILNTTLGLFLLFFIGLYALLPQEFFSARYLLPIYSLLIFPLSFGMVRFISAQAVAKYFLYFFILLFAVYYFINSVAILPYGFGWANTDKYLERIFIQDSTTYYDFDKQFNKHIDRGKP